MKSLFIFLVLAITYFSGYGQDPLLFEQDWYLHDLVIDGESNPPPSNDEVEYIPLNFYSDQFSDRFDTIVCEGLTGDNITVSAVDIFVEGFLILIDEPCNLSENNDYEILYYVNFFNAQEANQFFDYEITEDTDGFTLTLTNEMGHTAIYGNQPLSTPQNEMARATVFPNPATDQLQIASQHQITHLTLYDVTGKMVLERNGNTATLDVSALPPAVYFLNLHHERGSSMYKVVKK